MKYYHIYEQQMKAPLVSTCRLIIFCLIIKGEFRFLYILMMKCAHLLFISLFLQLIVYVARGYLQLTLS